jgi:hypothetical protein
MDSTIIYGLKRLPVRWQVPPTPSS